LVGTRGPRGRFGRLGEATLPLHRLSLGIGIINHFATFAGLWCLNLLKNTVYLETMKRLVKIAVCLASGLVLNAGARADDGGLPDNPYAPIAVRNVFSLNPPEAVDAASQAEPPPKITPNGI